MFKIITIKEVISFANITFKTSQVLCEKMIDIFFWIIDNQRTITEVKGGRDYL